jgi:hypothetical protein
VKNKEEILEELYREIEVQIYGSRYQEQFYIDRHIWVEEFYNSLTAKSSTLSILERIKTTSNGELPPLNRTIRTNWPRIKFLQENNVDEYLKAVIAGTL